jgi:hypothetical protein
MKIKAGPSGREVISLQKVDSLLVFKCDGELKKFSTMYSTALYTTCSTNFGWKSAIMPLPVKK